MNDDNRKQGESQDTSKIHTQKSGSDHKGSESRSMDQQESKKDDSRMTQDEE